MTPAQPTLDASRIEALRQLERASGRALVAEVIGSFLAVSPQRLAQLRAALAAGDRDAAVFIAHSWKGSSAQIGAAALAEVCRRIEAQLKDGAADLAVLAPEVDEAERELGRVAAALRAIEPTAGSPP